MGKSKCDDGEKDIQRDLTSMKKESNCKIWSKYGAKPLKLKEGTETNKEICEEVHEKYTPNHICMTAAVNYTGFGRIPTHGPHRPNWASFGEYSYCPPERYQHNLEHGCVIMLYHPCLDKQQVTTPC